MLLIYEGENLILEVLEGGTIPENTGELTISFDAVNPSAITENEIIGGFDTNTKKNRRNRGFMGPAGAKHQIGDNPIFRENGIVQFKAP